MPIFSKPTRTAADPATLPSVHAQIRAFLRSRNAPTATPVIPVHMPNPSPAIPPPAARHAFPGLHTRCFYCGISGHKLAHCALVKCDVYMGLVRRNKKGLLCLPCGRIPHRGITGATLRERLQNYQRRLDEVILDSGSNEHVPISHSINSLAVEPSTSDVEDDISADTLVSMPVHGVIDETDDDMSWELLYPDSPAPPQAPLPRSASVVSTAFNTVHAGAMPGPSWSSLFGSDVESDSEQFDNETEAVFVPQPMDEDTAYHFAYHYLASHGSAKHPINVPS
ncbi:hypothetical protein C8F01DRAFT_1091825 [Mycena amicta]|nr:hypothetical protein C8F01DRAFT_1091825 [Mycena amicta]